MMNHRKRKDADETALQSLPVSKLPKDSRSSSSTLLASSFASRSLPDKICTLIFEYLPLKDRKNVRLTCKLWYKCSKSASIARREKFVFLDASTIQDDVIEILPKSPCLNLEFRNLKVECLPPEFWEKCAHRVQTLRFHKCDLDEKTVKKIILHCDQMTDLEVFKSLQLHRADVADLNNCKSFAALDYFISKKIKRTKLCTLTIHFHCAVISGELLGKIFNVFPCIKHLSSSQCDFKNHSFSLKSPIQLEGLRYHHGEEGYTFSSMKSMPLLWIARLTRFTANLGSAWKSSSQTLLFNFLVAQTNLELIDLHIGMAPFYKDLIFHILKCCPKLRSLHVTCSFFLITKVKFTCAETRQFFSLISNLESLKLNCNLWIDTPSQPPLPNLAIRSLSLKNDPDNERFCEYILKCCPKLEHLILFEPTDDILQLIFKNLPHLRHLGLYDALFSHFSTRGLTGCNPSSPNERGISIKSLERLERLELCSKNKFTQELCWELQFRQLNYLKLWLSLSEISHADLCKMMLNMPALKTLIIDNRNCSEKLDEIVELCSHLKALEYFSYTTISTRTKASDASYWKPIFQKCPSLKYIYDGFTREVFFLNPFTKNIICDSFNNLGLLEVNYMDD